MSDPLTATPISHRMHYWLDSISGKDLPMEQRIFNCAILASVITIFLATFFSVVLAWWWVALALSFYTAIYSYVYYLGRFGDNLQLAVLLFSLSIASLLNVTWIIDRGAQGTAPYFMFVTLLMIIFTAKRSAPYIAVMLANLVVLNLVEQPMREWLDWELPHSPIGQLFSLLSAVGYIAVLGLFYRRLNTDKLDESSEEAMQQLRHGSEQVDHVADSLVQAGDILSSSAMQQKSAIEQLLATTEELAATAEQNNQIAVESITALRRAESQIVDSKDNIDQLLRFVHTIKNSGVEIQKINNVIDDIAWQTNLLSLNAMIEASRAGDSHGGFRVVALEVKRLAEGAAEAAASINKLLGVNLQAVQDGVGASEDMQTAFDSLIDEISPLSIAVRSMSEASMEQTQAILQINQGLTDIDKTITLNQQSAEETAKTAAELRKNAEYLLQVMQGLQQ